MHRQFLTVLFLFCFCAGEKPQTEAHAAPESMFADKEVSTQVPSSPPMIKSKPTWEMRSFVNWRQVHCDESNKCAPMGRATILVEFDKNGCRESKRHIDNQASLIQGYAPAHQFIVVYPASDALTIALFNDDHVIESPCRIFLYDDMPKADQKVPNEDQQVVELCKDSTSIADKECTAQLSDKKLYAP